MDLKIDNFTLEEFLKFSNNDILWPNPQFYDVSHLRYIKSDLLYEGVPPNIYYKLNLPLYKIILTLEGKVDKYEEISELDILIPNIEGNSKIVDEDHLAIFTVKTSCSLRPIDIYDGIYNYYNKSGFNVGMSDRLKFGKLVKKNLNILQLELERT